MRKEYEDSLNQIKKQITKQYGKPCEEYDKNCIVCNLWKFFNKTKALLMRIDKDMAHFERIKKEKIKKE